MESDGYISNGEDGDDESDSGDLKENSQKKKLKVKTIPWKTKHIC